MQVKFKTAGVKRIGQKRVEVAEGQSVDVQWSDLDRHPLDSYEIVHDVAPTPAPAAEPEPEPEPTVKTEPAEEAPAPAGKRGR